MSSIQFVLTSMGFDNPKHSSYAIMILVRRALNKFTSIMITSYIIALACVGG